jgi:hypothetical protein
MPTHKVIIELEFKNVPEGKRVLNCDVEDYLEELIYDGSLDYTVKCKDEEYGVIDWGQE